MDLTPTYIKMCEKAVEIQSHEPKYNDFYYFPKQELDHYQHKMNKLLAWEDIKYFKDEYEEAKIIWLPRQDQLHEILSNSEFHISAQYIIIHNNDGVGKYFKLLTTANSKEMGADSLEQLLLKMVMCFLYNKTWDGEEWIKTPKI